MVGRLAEHVAHQSSLPAEVEEGNVEYKYRISLPADGTSDARIQELATQVRWRLAEAGECTYMLGVEDDGTIPGLRERELAESLAALERMCAIAGGRVAAVDRVRVARRPELWAAEVLVAIAGGDAPGAERRRAVKVALIGPSGAGKTTLVGVLAQAGASPRVLDDGCGSVRVECLRHRHEVLSGRTSSVAVEFLAFERGPGDALRPVRVDAEGPADGVLAVEQQAALLGAPLVVRLVDLGGDPRYQRTSLAALTTTAAPDWLCIVGSSKAVVADHAACLEESLALAVGLEAPFFVVLTGTDAQGACPSEAVAAVHAAVAAVRTRLFGPDAVANALARCSDKTGGISKALTNPRARFVPPVLAVSCVTGAGLDNLVSHVSRLRPRRSVRLQAALDDLAAGAAGSAAPFVFGVEAVHRDVPDAGTVLAGTVLRGALALDSLPRSLSVGPLSDGAFVPVRVRSMRRLRLPVRTVSAGDAVSLAVDILPGTHGAPDANTLLSCSPLCCSVDACVSSVAAISLAAGTADGRRRGSLPGLGETRLAKTMFVLGGDAVPSWSAAMSGADVEADVVAFGPGGTAFAPGSAADSEPAASAENVQGTLYWMGTRHAAVLRSLREFYMADRLRAVFVLADGARAALLPATRMIFVSSSGALRLVGQPVASVRLD